MGGPKPSGVQRRLNSSWVRLSTKLEENPCGGSIIFTDLAALPLRRALESVGKGRRGREVGKEGVRLNLGGRGIPSFSEMGERGDNGECARGECMNGAEV